MTTVVMLLQNPVFVLSVDFELLWGYVQHPDDPAIGLLKGDSSLGRKSTMSLLGVLDRHRVPATWATVGNLFLSADRRILEEPSQLVTLGDCDPRLLHAPDLIEAIRNSPTGHEVAYHSLTHVRFADCPREVARRELDEGVRLATEQGIAFESFVFPENQIGHVELLEESSFRIYRGRNLGGRGVESGVRQRLKGIVLRRITAPPVYPTWHDGVWEIPGSMLFGDPLLPSSIVARAARGLEAAIARKAVFHVWLHPQDLLIDPGLEKRLDRFLGLVAEERQRGELQVLTMGGLAALLPRGVQAEHRTAVSSAETAGRLLDRVKGQAA